MNSKRIRVLLAGVLVLAGAGAALAAPGVPTHFSYQGMILDQNQPFTGQALFKFALVDTASQAYYWTNDGSPGTPEGSVAVQVADGLFSVMIGQGMEPIQPETVVPFRSNQALRVWVDLGNGFVLLGDQPLSSVLMAHRATYAEAASGGFTAGGIVWSKSGGFKFPDGTTQATAATGGGGGAATLDEAYDGGGAGLGRTITADAGAVHVAGSGGLTVESWVGLGTTTPNAPLQVWGNRWDVTNTFGDLMIGLPAYSLRFGVATDGLGAGNARIRAAGGTGRLFLGSGAYDVVKVDTVGFHVTRGPFQVLDSGKLSLSGDFGNGSSAGAIFARNTNPLGPTAWFEGTTYAPLLVANQAGTGGLFGGYESGSLVFFVDHHGATKTTGLEVTEGPMQVQSDGQTSVIGDFGPGQTGAALRTQNNNTGGIALWAETAGTDATIVTKQTGTGDLIRGFQGNDLKFRVLSQGQVVTPSVTITGGADLSEPFTMAGALGEIEPGTVLVIDPDSPGDLTVSDRPYDTRVAGIVSGAGGVNPGLILSQQGVLEGGRQVALSGRVYVRASTQNGPIKPGDMMTTSATAGVAMRATDRERSYGAVVGKAMTSLDSGEGLVLVLVGLQ